MEDGKEQTQEQLLLSAPGRELTDDAADHGDGSGEEGMEAEEVEYKGDGTDDEPIDSGGKGREVGGRQCGGIINHLMTHLVPGSAGESEQQKKQEEDSCGLIDHLISGLPINPDDETPAADEASLLISIIED